MQMRPRMHFQFIPLWRSFRDWTSPHDERAHAETSRSLIYNGAIASPRFRQLEDFSMSRS